jgi:beta-glucanase (GH16 family)
MLVSPARSSAAIAVVASLLTLVGCGGSDQPRVTDPTTPATPAASAPTPTPPVVTTTPVAAPAVAAPAPAAAVAPIVLFDPTASDALSHVSASGQPSAEVKLVTAAGGAQVVEFACQSGNSWPGLAIKPAGTEWNLSTAAGVEAVVANVGSAPAKVTLRVDENAKTWNAEQAIIAPGTTATVRVFFGTSYGKAGSAVAAAHLTNVLVFADKPAEGTRLQVRKLTSFGKPGDAPTTAAVALKPVVAKHVPPDPRVLTLNAATDKSRLQSGALKLDLQADGALVTVPSTAPAMAEVVYRPAKSLDLRDYSQAVFILRNAGTLPVRVALRVQGAAPDDLARREVELPAGSRQRVVVPFAPTAQWHGVTPGAPPVSDKPFLGAATEKTIVGLASDVVTALGVAIVAPAAGQQLAWDGVEAEVGGPAVLPSWIGTRPPVDGDWVKTFNDDFSGSQLDLTRWTPRLPWIGPIPWEFQRYNDKNVTVADGFLHIRCEKQTGHLYDNPAWPSRDYTTGALTTYDKWSVLYGYIETRFKLPKANGLWPAFWTMPDRGRVVDGKELTKNERRDTGNGGMEFDIFEHPNRFGPFRYNGACHWDGYGKDHRSTGSSRLYAMPDAEGFIIAGFLWEPGKVTWYCNGEPVGSWQDARISNVGASLKYTVQMGGWAGTEVDDSALPDDFVVDWVRVWQRRELLEPGKKPLDQ